MELENSYNRMSLLKSSFNFEELNEIYLNYKKILINEEKISRNNFEKNDLNYEFIQTFKENEFEEENSLIQDDWNDLIRDYMSEFNKEDFEKENTQNFQKRNYMKSFSQERKQEDKSRIDFAQSMQRLKNRFKESVQNQEMENYINLERYSYQKHLIKCNENKDRVRKLFDNHSSWLKNMRNEVFLLIYFFQ